MITVYTKYGCPQCEMTKFLLKNEGVEFETRNVEDDVDAMNYIKETLGLSSVPVTVKEGLEPIVGFNPDKLKGLKG